MKIGFYEENHDMVSDGSLGYIYFKIDGDVYTMSFRQLDALFEYREGSGQKPAFDTTELINLWETLGGRKVFKTSQSKSSDIKHPALRYFHRVVASTIFAKKSFGAVNDQELQMIDSAFKEFLVYASPEDMDRGITMSGDMGDTGNTSLLLASFSYYKTYAFTLHKSNRRGDICIGGLITPMLLACGVNLSLTEEIEPRLFDISHL